MKAGGLGEFPILRVSSHATSQKPIAYYTFSTIMLWILG